ncbi:MAG: transposase domain-containing protein, partial [Enterococcus faecalis]
MAVKYTEEQLNSVDKSFLIQLLLQQQEQLEAITKELHASNEKMQLLMEQVILGKQNRFGRSSEKMEDTSQICFQEVDGTIVFSMKRKLSTISMKENLMSWNSNLQNSQSVRERKNQIFPDLRSDGLTIICQR